MSSPIWQSSLVGAAIYLACSVCCAEKTVPTVESVLAKWEDASQKCRSLDAQLTVLRYDDPFRADQPTVEQGRFYYEAPNLGRYQVGESVGTKAGGWSGVAEAIIWNGRETLHINGRTGTCARFAHRDLQTRASQSGDFLSRLFARLFWILERPQNCLPVVVDIHAADLRERFEIAIEPSRNESEIEVKLTPKRPSDRAAHIEIQVILNAKTYVTNAVQTTLPDRRSRIVYVLHDQRVNQRPTDREELLNPNLLGLSVIGAP